MPKLIEEDIRYTTALDVRYGYSALDYGTRPVMSGYEFSLVLDQLDGFVLNHPTHSPKILLISNCGNCLWIAKHFEETNSSWGFTESLIFKNQPKVELSVQLDNFNYNRKTVSELSSLKCISLVDTKVNAFEFDVVVICVVHHMKKIYDSLEVILNSKPIIVYDPLRQLSHLGSYFLNSSILVKI